MTPSPTPADRLAAIDIDQLAAALVAGGPRVDRALASAVETLAAWRSLPPFVRRAYAAESKRMARRAAAALARLLEAARDERTPGGEVPPGSL